MLGGLAFLAVGFFRRARWPRIVLVLSLLSALEEASQAWFPARTVDAGDHADKAWLLTIQRRRDTWSRTNPDDAWRDMWNWVTQPQNLRLAWRRVASNRGARSSHT